MGENILQKLWLHVSVQFQNASSLFLGDSGTAHSFCFCSLSMSVNGLNLSWISPLWHSGSLSRFDNKGCTVDPLFFSAALFVLWYCSGSTKCSDRFQFRFVQPVSAFVGKGFLLQVTAAVLTRTVFGVAQTWSSCVWRGWRHCPTSAGNDLKLICVAQGFFFLSKWLFFLSLTGTILRASAT
jgi:hypothetical protein